VRPLSNVISLLLSLLLSLLAGCITPRAVIDGGRTTIDVSEFPAGTELISIPVKDGEDLRGVFVPAGPNAPIVLMFLESSGSITHGGSDSLSGYPVAWDLRGLGMALLCVDYRGVGMSGGEPTPDNIAADAMAAWQEALRRSNQRPERIVLRGMSLGTWATCSLLDRGATPAAVVLTAPVRSETIVKHVANNLDRGGFEAFLAKLLMRRPVNTDIVESLESARTPLLVMVGENDAYLPGAERTLVQEAVQRPGNKFHVLPERDHRDSVGDAHLLTSMERDLFARLFNDVKTPKDPYPYVGNERVERHLRARLPMHAGSGLLGWIRRLPHARIAALPDPALTALLSLDDPSGALDAAELNYWEYSVNARREANLSCDPNSLLAAINRSGQHNAVILMTDRRAETGLHIMSQAGPESRWNRMRLPERERLRQAFLFALKADLQPARGVTRNGRNEVEVWTEADGWRLVPVELSKPIDPAPIGG
jgi:pimeloyl-ACP methyl ester carboxylesterase